MAGPSPPTGYDVSKHVQTGRSNCLLTVGFDRTRSHIPRFLVQLHYQVATDPVRWKAIARMDHNETSATGHNVYREGLHVDVDRCSSKEVHLKLKHGTLPTSRGAVIRRCGEYFQREADYFISVYEEQRPPGAPPSWPDGGNSTPTFIRPNELEESMSQESPVENALSLDELTEELAEAEGTTVEEIERSADDLEIAPPEEATVVDE